MLEKDLATEAVGRQVLDASDLVEQANKLGVAFAFGVKLNCCHIFSHDLSSF